MGCPLFKPISDWLDHVDNDGKTINSPDSIPNTLQHSSSQANLALEDTREPVSSSAKIAEDIPEENSSPDEETRQDPCNSPEEPESDDSPRRISVVEKDQGWCHISIERQEGLP